MGLPVVMREAGPFTATGGETLLPFGFAISRADDIAVYRTRGTVTGTLTLITDYAVDGVGLANGGNVVLVLPAVPGDVYKIVGYASLERDGAVVAGAGFIAGLNRDLDRLTRVDQEIRRDLKRAMVLNPLDSGDAALPPRVPNKLLGVDEAGRWAMRDAGGGAPGGVDAAAVQGIVTDVLDTEFAAYARNYVIADPAERRADLGIDIPVKSATQTAPPASPADGDRYLVPAGASGAFAAHAGKVVRWNAETTAWVPRTPTRVESVWADDTNQRWQYDTGGWVKTDTGGSALSYAAIDARIVGVMTTHRGGGGKFLVVWTADQRILVWGDNTVFPFNPAGARGSAYEIAVPWDTKTVSIEAIYAGQNYILVQTSEATGNLYAMGANAKGQCGDGTTTNVTFLKRVQKFVDDAVKIVRVYTEATHYTNEFPFWFSITSGANVYSCGSGFNFTQGNDSTSDVLTPRKMTFSDGATPLTNIDAIACDTVYGPVFAHTASNNAIVWGAGTDGANGRNKTSNIGWPQVHETSVGSGVYRTDIAQIVTCSSAIVATRAVTWLRTTAGAVQVAGSRQFGNGDGSPLLTAASNTFQPITGALASLTVTALRAGGGEYYSCVAIAGGNAYIAGYMASFALRGDGIVTNLNTFSLLVGLPAGFAGAVTGALVAGGNTFTTIYLEATIAGAKQIASIGYDGFYQTAKGTTGVAAANQTWGLVKGARGALVSWGAFGNQQIVTHWQLNADAELRTAGANDAGQAGVSPGQLTAIDTLQPVRTGLPRQTKVDTPRGVYDGTTVYSKRDTVLKGGSTWRYTSDVAASGTAPPDLPTEINDKWELVARAGMSASVGVGATVTVSPATNPSVANAGTPEAADLRFSLPRARNVTVGTVTTGAPGSAATVTPTIDASGDVSLAFSIPAGLPSTVPGAAATVSVPAATVVTPAAGPSVTNTGSSSAAVLAFALPRARNITIGSVTTGAPGSAASVTPTVDADGDISLAFAIPRGADGLGNPGGSSGQLQYNGAGAFAGMVGTIWDATNQHLTIAGKDYSPGYGSGATLTLSKTRDQSVLDIRADPSGMMVRFKPGFDWGSTGQTYETRTYVGNSGEIETQAWMTVSGTWSGTGDGLRITKPSTDPYMIGIWADVPTAFQTRTYPAAGGRHWTALDRTGKYVLTVEEYGNIGWAASSATYAFDTGLSRIAAGKLAVGTGAAGSFAGSLKLTSLEFADGTTQSSASAGGYTLPTASGSVLGGVKVGANLSIDGAGVLTAATNIAQTWSAQQTFSVSPLLTNNMAVQTKTVAGTTVNLFQLDSSDAFQLGNAAIGHISIHPGTGKQIRLLNAAQTAYIVCLDEATRKSAFGSNSFDGLVTFYDNTATTGDTTLAIRDGAARAARVMFGAGGTYDVGFSRNAAGQLSVTDASTTLTNFRDLQVRDLFTSDSAFLIRTKATLTGGSVASAPTLTSGPVNGNPSKWLPIDDNGTTRYVPAW